MSGKQESRCECRISYQWPGQIAYVRRCAHCLNLEAENAWHKERIEIAERAVKTVHDSLVKLEAENERLSAVICVHGRDSRIAAIEASLKVAVEKIEAAPHDAGGSGCYALDMNGSECNCWKAEALAAIKEAK